jgi:hypothetical protein
MNEVLVCSQQRQIVSDAELRKNRIDGSYLDAGPAAAVADFGRINVVLAIRGQQWKGAEAIDNFRPITGAGKSLEEFLQDEASGYHRLANLQSALQCIDFRRRTGPITAKGEGPDTGVDQEGHLRERSFL